MSLKTSVITKLGRRVALATAALVVALLIAELVVRVLGVAPALNSPAGSYQSHPVFTHTGVPTSRLQGTSASGEFDFEYVHNSLGFRDVEHEKSKPEATFRILSLGDSFTYGAGAEFEETYLYRLEEKLNAQGFAGKRVEIINTGTPRYYPEAERLVLEHLGLSYEPDLVIVGFLPNDVIDTAQGRDAISVSADGYLVSATANKLGSLGVTAYVKSHFFRLLWSKLVVMPFLCSFDFGEVYKANGRYEESWRSVEAEYQRMLDLTSSIGARLAVVHIPQGPPWEAAQDYPATRLGAWCKQRDVLFIDTLPALRASAKASDKPLYWPKDGHANAAGHAVIADAIYRRLVEDGL